MLRNFSILGPNIFLFVQFWGYSVPRPESADGLTGNSVEYLYADAEENLWVVTAKGLDVFRDTRVATISTREGLSSDHVQSVLAARDGSIWIGNHDSLDVLHGSKVSWIRPRDGLQGHRVTSLWEDVEGRIWVGIDRTLTIFGHGRFRSVPRSDGRPPGIVAVISEDTDRNIWTVTAQGPGQRVFRIADDRDMQEFNESEIPATRVLAPDPHGGARIGLYNGSLARYRAGKLETVAKDLSPRDVLSLAVDKDGSFWGASRSGLFRWSEGRFNRLGLCLSCDRCMFGLLTRWLCKLRRGRASPTPRTTQTNEQQRSRPLSEENLWPSPPASFSTNPSCNAAASALVAAGSTGATCASAAPRWRRYSPNCGLVTVAYDAQARSAPVESGIWFPLTPPSNP